MAPYGLAVRAAHYVDPVQTREEMRVLFNTQPLLVGLTPDAPDVGDFFTHEAAQVSLVLVRDTDRRVRAYVNACRHRGSRIAEGRGTAGSFSCPFHAWNWNIDGSIRSRPNSCGGFDGIADEFSRLHEVACLELAGMIFVMLEGDDIETRVAALLGDALAELRNYRIDETVYFESRITERDCNYKFIMDGFTESYHIAALHKETISPYYYTRPALTDVFGSTIRMIGVRRSIDKEFDKPAAERRLLPHGTTQYLIGPNVILTHQVDHMQLWRMYPVSGRADLCRIEFSLYWPAPMDDEARRKSRFNVDVLWQVTTEEDFPQSLAIHKNLAGTALPELIFGRNEPALVYYHEAIARATDPALVRRVS
jgi:phenylpropionate dioxygenase-like ring-hydroxylating dioxygenase large terminal subunit